MATNDDTSIHETAPTPDVTPAPVPDAAPADPVAIACAIAKGEMAAPEGAFVRVRAAYADYNARGRRRAHWYRMVYQPGAAGWEYFAEDRLKPVGMLAATRHQTVYGDVMLGDIVAQHDHGGPVDVIYLVVGDNDEPLKKCEFARRNGELRITLPDGTVIRKTDPRRR
jgi:hypothetical protein